MGLLLSGTLPGRFEDLGSKELCAQLEPLQVLAGPPELEQDPPASGRQSMIPGIVSTRAPLRSGPAPETLILAYTFCLPQCSNPGARAEGPLCQYNGFHESVLGSSFALGSPA